MKNDLNFFYRYQHYFNIFFTICLFVGFWLLFIFFIPGFISDNISPVNVTADRWTIIYQTCMNIFFAVTFFFVLLWYLIASLLSYPKILRVRVYWYLLFVLEIIFSIGLSFWLIIYKYPLNRGAGFIRSSSIITGIFLIFGILLFYLSTFLFSPSLI